MRTQCLDVMLRNHLEIKSVEMKIYISHANGTSVWWNTKTWKIYYTY